MIKHVKNPFFIIALCIMFLLIIHWSADFKLLSFSNVKQFIILLATTLLLMIIANAPIGDKEVFIRVFRFNLFTCSILISFFSVIDIVSSEDVTKALNNNPIVMGIIKPWTHAIIIYAIGINLIDHWIKTPPVNLVSLLDAQGLSKREKEVAQLALAKKNNKEIAKQLYISEMTVKKHMQSILKKTNCEDRIALQNKYYKQIKNIY